MFTTYADKYYGLLCSGGASTPLGPVLFSLQFCQFVISNLAVAEFTAPPQITNILGLRSHTVGQFCSHRGGRVAAYLDMANAETCSKLAQLCNPCGMECSVSCVVNWCMCGLVT